MSARRANVSSMPGNGALHIERSAQMKRREPLLRELLNYEIAASVAHAQSGQLMRQLRFPVARVKHIMMTSIQKPGPRPKFSLEATRMMT